MLAGFFSILLSFGFAVIQMPMLPVEPGMAQFVGENVAPSRHGQALTKIDGLRGVVPDAVGIRVPTIHVGIGKSDARRSDSRRETRLEKECATYPVLLTVYQRITKSLPASRLIYAVKSTN